MTNPKYQKLYNVPTGCLWQPAVSLLWSIQSLLQSQSVPAALCIFTSAIDYQTIFDDYSSSPCLSLHAPYQDTVWPIRGLMESKMTNERTENCLRGLVILRHNENHGGRKMMIHYYVNAPCGPSLKPTWTNRVMGQFKT